MRVHEIVQRLERQPQKRADTVTQEEARRADNLYQKFLNYFEGLGGNPWNPPTEEEMKFLAEFMGKVARRGERHDPPTE